MEDLVSKEANVYVYTCGEDIFYNGLPQIFAARLLIAIVFDYCDMMCFIVFRTVNVNTSG